MSKGNFHIHTLSVSKSAPALPIDFKLPNEADRITGVLFNLSQKYTGYNEVQSAGLISISLNNGVSKIIDEADMKTCSHLIFDMETVNEKARNNGFARVFYEDKNHPDVDADYKVKIYLQYEKEKSNV